MKVAENEHVKIVLGACLRRKWFDLRGIKIKMFPRLFCTYYIIHLNSKNAYFSRYLFVCLSIRCPFRLLAGGHIAVKQIYQEILGIGFCS